MQPWKSKIPFSPLFLSLSLFVVAVFLYNENVRRIQEAKAALLYREEGVGNGSRARNLRRPERNGRERRAQDECDLFSGRWVLDNFSHPLYSEEERPYMSDQLAWRKYGRPDMAYRSWRWQPHHCNLTRWNATAMLEKLRGKRLMFVGDSLNRGQWISMVCLLQSVLSPTKKSMTPKNFLTIFTAEEYNATVEFYWVPLLVESNSDDPVNHRLSSRIIRPDSIAKHGSYWKHADILVFNSYLWWRGELKIKLLKGEPCEESEGLDAMNEALRTWADGVDSNVDARKTRVFFVTMSPIHLWTTLIEREDYWGSGSDLRMKSVLENVFRERRSRVTVLNITPLSEYQKDETFKPKQLLHPEGHADCIHWCLPGVLDVWNELLFNLL
ncbi:hypothetical protein AMTRI_Chr08g166070 [Amborella trichopoda]